MYSRRKIGNPATLGIMGGEGLQPWCTIALAEDAIEEKHKTVLPGR